MIKNLKNEKNDFLFKKNEREFNLKIDYVNMFEFLHSDIEKFMSEYKIEIIEHRENILKLFFVMKERLSSIIKSKIKIHGSYATGLEMPWSDLDLMMIILDNSESLENIIEKIKNNLKVFLKARKRAY
jgi:predicted nucleotidyltransferase